MYPVPVELSVPAGLGQGGKPLAGKGRTTHFARLRRQSRHALCLPGRRGFAGEAVVLFMALGRSEFGCLLGKGERWERKVSGRQVAERRPS
jgi:hypothetical protein